MSKPANSAKSGKRGGVTKTTWVKGIESPNPTGRPKDDPEFIEACRERTPKALATLERAMDNYESAPGPAVKAAEVMLNRAWGTAPQTIKLDAKLQADVTHALHSEPRTPGWEMRVAAVLLQAGALEASGSGGRLPETVVEQSNEAPTENT